MAVCGAREDSVSGLEMFVRLAFTFAFVALVALACSPTPANAPRPNDCVAACENAQRACESACNPDRDESHNQCKLRCESEETRCASRC